jgi:hypothetical protein
MAFVGIDTAVRAAFDGIAGIELTPASLVALVKWARKPATTGPRSQDMRATARVRGVPR